MWKKCQPADGGFDYAITNDVLRKIERNPHDCAPWMREEIERLRDRYQFLHWHLAFPEVFSEPEKSERPANEHAGWNGGFDVMLGNPPWERVKLQEKEWFAERRPEIANAVNSAARKRLIESLKTAVPVLHAEFQEAIRQAEGESHIMRDSGIYPLCGCGDINLYAVFAEGMRVHLNSIGRVGCVLPSGIATGDTTKFFFQNLIQTKSLVSLFSFMEIRLIFIDTDSREPFCLFTAGSGQTPIAEAAEFVFFARSVEEFKDPQRRFTLSADAIRRLNPNTQTCPVFRTRADADITKEIYGRVPVLLRELEMEENPLGVTFSRMLDMSNDSKHFRTRQQLEDEGWKLGGNIFHRDSFEYSPLYEAKMTNLFDHRFGSIVGSDDVAELSGIPAQPTTLAQHQNPNYQVLPRYWVPKTEVIGTIDRTGWKRGFLINTRDVARATDARTAIQTILPTVGVGHKAPLILPMLAASGESGLLLANFNAFVLDFVVRQKMGGASFSYFIIKQLPVLPPATYAEPCAWAGQPAVTLRDWLLPRVLELTYTAWDLEPFARDSGWFGPPFVWDEARRFQLRCELDAAFLHLYGLSRADAAYILDTFPIVRRKDEATHGTYRTRDTILALYDQFAECAREARAFVSPLAIQPAGVLAAHEPRLPAKLRPAFASPDYFQHIVPLIARLQPQGVEIGRLLHALEILAESEPRRAALNGHDGEPWKQWAKDFPKSHAFSDAAAALIVLLGEGTLTRWQGRIRLAPDAPVLDEEWLNADAFMALRLALAAPAETVQRRRTQHEQHFPALRELLLVA